MAGLIDTVKFKADVPLHAKDRDGLMRLGFEHHKNVSVIEDETNQRVVSKEMYYNEKTGLRVFHDGFTTRIEGSIPRVLGLSNGDQESVTEEDAQIAMDLMTYNILPYSSPPNCWGITRLDLARNFEANIPQVIGAYSNLKHPEVRRQTKTVFSESVMYYGSNREIVIYDKGLEMGGKAGVLGRAECRWKGQKGIDKLVVQLSGSRLYYSKEPMRFCLPLYLKGISFDGERQVFYLETTYQKLNQVMKSDLERLGAPGPVRVFSSAVEIALDAMQNHPDEYSCFLATMTGRSLKRWRQRLKQFKQRQAEVDVVKLIQWDAVEAA